MTSLREFFASWAFRDRFPDFEPGERHTALVTGVDERRGEPVVRVGDTRLFLPDASGDLVDTLVVLEVTSFDPDEHTGEARVLEELGSPSF